MITDYDCRNAFIKVDKLDYYDELEKGNESFESAQLLAESNKYSDAYIILYKALQNIGNAVLINRFLLRSQSKNCQFQFLHEEKIISDKEIAEISDFSVLRNDVYYNNTSFMGLEEDEYKAKYDAIIIIAKKLKEEIK